MTTATAAGRNFFIGVSPLIGIRPARMRSREVSPNGPEKRKSQRDRAPTRLECGCHNTQGTTGFDVVDSVGLVASRGPGRPRKTPGKTISADSHEYALAA